MDGRNEKFLHRGGGQRDRNPHQVPGEASGTLPGVSFIIVPQFSGGQNCTDRRTTTKLAITDEQLALPATTAGLAAAEEGSDRKWPA